MGESDHRNHYPQQLHRQHHGSGPSRRRVAGEIVEVQGGHIMRSTGRKDRHSKVCTAKGPRDRRVRLSAHTAIQFYDVQDRLGYDRPSKAVDWLIKNAKAAIDELAELPPWRPTGIATDGVSEATDPPPVNYAQFGNSGILPASLNSDAIADTIKSFFPVATGTASTDYMHTEDLRLSLQSLPSHSIPIHHHHRGEQFPSSSNPLSYETSPAGWPEQNARMIPWASVMTESGNGGGGYMFGLPLPPSQVATQQAMHMHPAMEQSSLVAQRGPLQSSNSPLARSWIEAIGPPPPRLLSADGSFGGFRIPARIQGEEENDGISNFPSLR